ncbi:MAG: hypothetical protein ACXWNK_04380 [Vulcanimicrobiaceae bacterium]
MAGFLAGVIFGISLKDKWAFPSYTPVVRAVIAICAFVVIAIVEKRLGHPLEDIPWPAKTIGEGALAGFIITSAIL